MIYKPKDLSPDQRAAAEILLGCPLLDHQAIRVIVFGSQPKHRELPQRVRAAMEGLLQRPILDTESIITWGIRLQPEFAVGDRVSVHIGGRNRTPHTGEVSLVDWHFKESKYVYRISEAGKTVKKRY